MTSYLALKHAAPSGFWARLFHYITQARLLTRYPHAGIVQGGMLMHCTRSHGLHATPFDHDGWHLFPLPYRPWQEGLFERLKGTPYDTFSLLAFATPFDASDSARLYCYEWAWLWLTGENPGKRVTPEMLLVEQSRSWRT